MSTEPPIIQCDGVSFAYGELPTLTNVSFTVQALDTVSLVGPNGGGKSTLLKLILGLLSPQQGTISVFGTSPKQARSQIGYMPQHLQYDTDFPVSVMEVVLMGRARPGWAGLGRYSRSDRSRCLELMAELGVESLATSSFSELSGGQRQRVLIARALACEPELLLLDEPMANVDPAVEFQFFEILKRLSQRVTVMTVSHDLGFVSQLVDRVFCINHELKIHPTSELTGDLIREMYGADVRMVRHDHSCGEEGHRHDRIF